MKIRHRQAAGVLAAILFSLATIARVEAAAAPEAGRSEQRFSSAQLLEIQARERLAHDIIGNVAADAENCSDRDWQVRLLSALYSTPSEGLKTIAGVAYTVDAAHAMALQAYSHHRSVPALAGGKSLDTGTSDLTFTPKTPCRFIDTRNVGGVIVKGAANARNFDTEAFGSTYGGDSTCTLPGNGEFAIAVNATVTVPSGPAGFLGIRPYGTTSTSTSLVNWPAGGTPGVANAGIITTATDASGHYEFTAYAGGNSPQLILDYFGYFAPAAPTALDCVTSGMASVSVDNSGDAFGVGCPSCDAKCPAGYATVSVHCEADAPTMTSFSSQYNALPTCTFNFTGTGPQPAHIGATCCRVP